jgi:hypothetical protein
MLVGDSHAGHWKDAMAAAASEAGVRLVVRWRSSCPAIPVTLLDTRGLVDATCAAFQSDTLELVRELRPDAVVLSQSAAYGARILSARGTPLDADERLERWRAALDDFLERVDDAGAAAAVVVDNPRLDFDPIECVSRILGDTATCSSHRDEALDGVETLNAVSEDVVHERSPVAAFDVTDDICDAERCYAERNGVPVFRDYNHLSEVWTTTRVDDLRDWFIALTR